MGIIKEYKRRRARGDNIRPLWQIAILLPLWPIYWVARQIVNLFEALDDAL